MSNHTITLPGQILSLLARVAMLSDTSVAVRRQANGIEVTFRLNIFAGSYDPFILTWSDTDESLCSNSVEVDNLRQEIECLEDKEKERRRIEDLRNTAREKIKAVLTKEEYEALYR